MGAITALKVDRFRIAWTAAAASHALAGLVVRERVLPPGGPVLRQGAAPTTAHVLLDGYTYHSRLLVDGSRQITALQVPGDVCDLFAVLRGRADYDVVALTRCVFGEVPARSVAHAVDSDPEAARPLWRQVLMQEAIAREWLVGLGRRAALERVAHLLCEVRIRLDDAGLAPGGAELRLPFTQAELADVLGLSAVHVNRVLQALRRNALVAMARGSLTILDVSGLESVAGFDGGYLRPA